MPDATQADLAKLGSKVTVRHTCKFFGMRMGPARTRVKRFHYQVAAEVTSAVCPNDRIAKRSAYPPFRSD